MARSIGVATTARSDYGVLLPLLRVLREHPGVRLQIYAGGTHFSAINGFSIGEVEEEFGECTIRVPCEIKGDGPADLAEAMAEVLAGYGRAFSADRPDILVVLGDRYDMIPVVLAALPFNIPVAHLSGGEVTEGVIDDAIRHAVTKLSHLHFPTAQSYGRRIMQLGEEEWRIHVVGEPGLDLFRTMELLPKDEVYGELGLDPGRPLSLFTYHPETIGYEDAAANIAEILAAADLMSQTQILFTHPNSDTGSLHILEAIRAYVKKRGDCLVVPSLGKRRYFQFLGHCDCLVGNSSSGIIEAATFRLPVVNIGTRQAGRIEPRNVVTTPTRRDAIAEAWGTALSSQFRAALDGMENPYGDGLSSARIADILVAAPLSRELIRKKFIDRAEAIPVENRMLNGSIFEGGDP
ncbi:UDP-N-acetylglucosamine 2-epimerase [Methylocystis heyeri]|uniref:UDP-N-acetylglucosamine 2-epimerase (Hydrolyzing) n=1 Tax=Methylocystis heyeri TaxID=391905 RepID=A0A6B8KCD6_9HYPH|nr:UDP-N-acetylglucosamine 2-epimerase [Methylocystis heyeri]QGM45242.1 UDP-N-acetylglucosamine 2-epimerase (hydrolyzing) [Methylocystis heyeri]